MIVLQSRVTGRASTEINDPQRVARQRTERQQHAVTPAEATGRTSVLSTEYI
jgi:hypothetical protein